MQPSMPTEPRSTLRAFNYLSGLPAAGLAGAASCEAPSPAERGRTQGAARGAPQAAGAAPRARGGSGRALKRSPGRAPPARALFTPSAVRGSAAPPAAARPAPLCACATLTAPPPPGHPQRSRRHANGGETWICVTSQRVAASAERCLGAARPCAAGSACRPGCEGLQAFWSPPAT